MIYHHAILDLRVLKKSSKLDVTAFFKTLAILFLEEVKWNDKLAEETDGR
jgi:hypothetical protein